MNELIEIGYIAKTHGYKGHLKTKFYPTFKFDERKLKIIYIGVKGDQLPHFIESLSFTTKEEAHLKVEEYDNKEDAAHLRGCKLYLLDNEVETITQEIDNSHQYVGFEVSDVVHGILGKVEDVYEFPHQDLLVLTYNEKEVLIPFQEGIVEEIKEKEKIIITNLPEGMLDL